MYFHDGEGQRHPNDGPRHHDYSADNDDGRCDHDNDLGAADSLSCRREAKGSGPTRHWANCVECVDRPEPPSRPAR
jgi:hypothetical protein